MMIGNLSKTTVDEKGRVHFDPEIFLPKYQHLLYKTRTIDIDLLYGGRDSGKTYFLAGLLLTLCMYRPYFRCLLVRKVFNTIKGSQWQVLKDLVMKWGLQDFFVFHTSPLEIIYTPNGNSFIARGMDDPGNLKSLSNPSVAWVEEGNQLTRDDIVLLLTSLRADEKVKTYISFNPEAPGDFDDFWLYQFFYADRKGDVYKTFEGVWSVQDEDDPEAKPELYRFRSTHSTYKDNPHCKAARIVFYKQLKILDPYHYETFTLGRWHNRKAGDPFAHAFNREKQVGPVVVNPRFDVKLSFDFNINPITCGVYQDDGMQRIRVVEAIQLEKSDIYKLCDYISAKYGHYLLQVTGDATGRNTTALVQDGINYYTVIKTQLRLGQGQMKVPVINPIVKENRVLVNAVLSQLNVRIDPVNAKGLIYDLQSVAVTESGDIDKGSRTNPAKRADHLDHFRYYLNTWHKKVLKLPPSKKGTPAREELSKV